jgi:hypothetical protein
VKIYNQTEEQKKASEEWIESRPPLVRKMIREYPPDRLYLLKTTNHRVFLYSYSENGTVTVTIIRKYNPNLDFERRVFGIELSDLEECDLLKGEKIDD